VIAYHGPHSLIDLASVNGGLVVRWKLTPSPPSGKAKQSDPVSLLGLLNIGSGLERAKQLRYRQEPGLLLFFGLPEPSGQDQRSS
jgi:hypothetical protein